MPGGSQYKLTGEGQKVKGEKFCQEVYSRVGFLVGFFKSRDNFRIPHHRDSISRPKFQDGQAHVKITYWIARKVKSIWQFILRKLDQ